MSSFLPTIILRHRKENLKKCSLRGLEDRQDLEFLTYPQKLPSSLENYVMLHLENDDTPELSLSDASCGLFLIDSTWNYEPVIHEALKKKYTLSYRSLPKNFITAYPRKQTACSDPSRGLATVEALYIAYAILQRPCKDLLDHYYWKELFLEKNQDTLSLLHKIAPM